nr:molybdopterin dinucleotide binding domain-containing protein [Micromonospora sp. DSM 115978]
LEATLRQAVGNPRSPVAGRDVAELRALVTGDSPAERLLDVAVRIGAYGDAFSPESQPDGLTLAKLLDNPHGVDLGPLQSRVPHLLRTASGKIELCPDPIAADVSRLREAAAAFGEGLVLIGRRHLRSNNSWMHNVEPLVKGRDRCTLLVHPDDAARFGTAYGTLARETSRAGSAALAVALSA